MLLTDEECEALLLLFYLVGDIATFVDLMLRLGESFTAWWHWPIVLILSFLGAQIWPLYWALLHWL